jgi:hypothetical protein
MTIEVSPETEGLIREEIESGHFDSVDELIVRSVGAWREKLPKLPVKDDDPMPGRHLVEVLMSAPLGGEDLIIERIKEMPRQIEL